MNNTNIKQIDGGTIIKQGDFASRLSFELLDENKEPIDLEGKEAVVTLNTVYGNEVYLNKALTVSKSSVSFTIDQILPTGSYNIEIKCEGYIFPSDNHAIIKVEKGHDKYVPGEPDIKVPTQSDVEKVVDDKINNPEYIEKVKGAKGEPGEKGERGEAGPQGDPGKDGEPGKQGEVGASAYETWLALGNEGSEEDFINSLKAQSANVKRGPTGHFLDRTTTPWTIVFDNNCSLQLPDYPTSETVYGYGFGNASPFGQDAVSYPITLSILRSSNGSLSIPKWKSNNGGALYWSDSTKVINPINDKEKFDFTNGKYNEKDTNVTSLARQKNVIRVMYELGIWSEKDILDLGVVEK